MRAGSLHVSGLVCHVSGVDLEIVFNKCYYKLFFLIGGTAFLAFCITHDILIHKHYEVFSGFGLTKETMSAVRCKIPVFQTRIL